MRIYKKRFFLALTMMVLIGGISSWLWHRAHQPPPQIITLPDGTRLRFAGVSYSSNAVPPIFEARLIRHLPMGLSNLVWRFYGPRLSQYNPRFVNPGEQLFVWFERFGTNLVPLTNASIVAKLSEETGVEAGNQSLVRVPGGVRWIQASFSVAPKRSRMLFCNLYISPDLQKYVPAGKVSFPNPVFGRFPQWTPEPVPNVKQSGDLAVRLNRVESYSPPRYDRVDVTLPDGRKAMMNAPRSRMSFDPPEEPSKGGENIDARFVVTLSSSNGIERNWYIDNATLSDVTGNKLVDTSLLGRQSIDQLVNQARYRRPITLSFRGGLWPSESAWLLRLELKSLANFASDQFVTFTNLPVPAKGAVNTRRFTNTALGIPIVITDFAREVSIPGHSFNPSNLWLRLELTGREPGIALDLLDMKSELGPAAADALVRSNSSLLLLVKPLPINAQMMDFTFILQKTRAVEFLVRPPPTR